jgi:hypothetical protein
MVEYKEKKTSKVSASHFILNSTVIYLMIS